MRLISSQVEDMDGDQWVIVTRLGILHDDVVCIRYDCIRVVRGVVDRKCEFVDSRFVEAKEGHFARIRRPPERIIGSKDFFLVDPIGDAVKEGCVPRGGHADRRRMTAGASVNQNGDKGWCSQRGFHNIEIVGGYICNGFTGWRPGGVCCDWRICRWYDWIGRSGFQIVDIIIT